MTCLHTAKFFKSILPKLIDKRYLLGVALIFYNMPSFAQSEHDSHHPGAAQETSASQSTAMVQATDTDVATRSEPIITNGPGMGKGGMGKGGGKGGGMDKMMEKMGAPKPKDLYPSLMRLPELSAKKAEEVLNKAVQRMQKGNQLMITGFTALADADSQQNFSKMQSSIAIIDQGLSQYNSGLSAKRAIVEGQEPRRVALQWFKSQMNLLPTSSEQKQPLIFGMTSFHTGVMLILLFFAAVMLWMYAFKMRRASALLQELATAPTPSTTVDSATNTANPANFTASPTSSIKSTTAPQAENVAPTATTPLPSATSGIKPVSKSAIFKGKMCVVGIFSETHDVKTFRFVALDGGTIPFDYQPGQFVTFTLDIPEQPKLTKRSYTIASSPTQRDYFEVTIKREEQGLVSRFMHDNVLVGDALEIKAPSGKFYFNGENEDSIVLVSGGVGITPMMSAVRYLTTRCWKGEIYFLFCTRSSNDFIFVRELQYLQARHKNLHVLVSMTRAEGTSWMGPQGRFTPQLVNDFVPDIAEKTAHICGPPPMMDAMKNMLIELGMAPDRVKSEGFGGAAPKKKDAMQTKDVAPTAVSTEAKISTIEATTTAGFEVSFTQSNKKAIAKPDETILDIAEALDVEIETSCRAGSCGTCKVKLVSGQVDIEVDDALEDDEKEQGYILACQSVPKTPVAIEA